MTNTQPWQIRLQAWLQSRTSWDELQSKGGLFAFGALAINLVSLVASWFSKLELQWIWEKFALEFISALLLAAGYLAMRIKLPRFLSIYSDWSVYQTKAGATATAPITEALQQLANDEANDSNGVEIDREDLRLSMVHFRSQFCKSGPEFSDSAKLHAGTITTLEIRKRSIPDAFRFTRHLVGGAYSKWWRYGTALTLLFVVAVFAGRGIFRIFELIVRLM